MKILLLNTYDNKGGAARASYRIAKALNEHGEDISFVVRKKTINEHFVFSAKENFPGIKPYLDYIPTLIFSRRRFPFFSALVRDNLQKHLNDIKPDIIHLNWVSEGFIRIETLAKFNIPIVWTLHDSWAFTGGCHVPGQCEKYKTECHYCPYLSPKFKSDLSNFNFRRKYRSYKKVKSLTIVTPSQWLAEEVRSSALLRNFNVNVIPNGLDINVFSPADKINARKSLSLDTGKKTIVFGGINSVRDENKGYLLLEKAAEILDNSFQLIVFGDNKTGTGRINKINIIFLGKVYDEEKLREIYSAGDVTVVPSLNEVFGQVITESMACGTPVVAFDTTGPREIIKHKKNGYLAEAYNTIDLAEGIKWIVDEKPRYKKLSENAVMNVKLNYSSNIIAKRYINLYKQILLDKIVSDG